jgi:hypothetical protein
MISGRRIPRWLPLLVSIPITLVLLLVAAGSCGVGHGDCYLFVYFFPLMALLAVIGLLGEFPILFGLIQFPLYAIILSAAIAKQRTKPAAIGLIAFHLLAVILILFVFD